MELEPITRQEKIIAGQDLTPITRMEKFLKQFGGSGGGGGGGAQSDWNQNDETQPDFVKNRPFYETKQIVTVENVSDAALERFPIFAVGDTVTVIVDGVEHSLVAYEDEGSATIGDTYNSINKGEGQLGWQIYFNDREEVMRFFAKEAHTVSYYFGIKIVKIDPKYLPDSVVVLYTAQTVTDAQKKQARDNIDAASDFVVNATKGPDWSLTLDKTFTQIREAALGGKRVLMSIGSVRREYFYVPLLRSDADRCIFVTKTIFDEIQTIVVSSDNAVTVSFSHIRLFKSDGYLPQAEMESDPDYDMQIATKQYVDNKECILKSTTPGSTKKFKITVDDSGTLKATEVT